MAGFLLALLLQVSIPKFIVGTVAGFNSHSAEIQVKADAGNAISVKVSTSAELLRVPPGEKDLSKATPIRITDIGAGDRVLVNLMPAAYEARRIVVMPSADIAKRNEADRQDWMTRGLAGIVAAKNGNEITLRNRTMQGETRMTVTVDQRTQFRRYAPDSVKFADAKSSNLREIAVGDQLRARGLKSEDGFKVAAEEVVFGTFLTKAASVTAVNAETREISAKDLATNKPLVIKLTGDSQFKKLPDFAAMHAGRAGPGGGGMIGGDISAMWERMWDRLPPAAIDDLKPGETVVVSSTKGAKAGELTAIMLVGNADFLIRVFSMASAAPGARGAAAAAGMSGAMGMGAGLGLDLPGMIP